MRNALFLCLFSLIACGGDSGTGPDGVTFPGIPLAVRSQFCIRGNMTPPTTANGSIGAADCSDGLVWAELERYETWRVRVKATTKVTFSLESPVPDVDNYLYLYKVGDLNNVFGTLQLIAEDDDSGPDFNATLTRLLSQDTEYWIVVAVYDESDFGAYTLQMPVG